MCDHLIEILAFFVHSSGKMSRQKMPELITPTYRYKVICKQVKLWPIKGWKFERIKEKNQKKKPILTSITSSDICSIRLVLSNDSSVISFAFICSSSISDLMVASSILLAWRPSFFLQEMRVLPFVKLIRNVLQLQATSLEFSVTKRVKVNISWK